MLLVGHSYGGAVITEMGGLPNVIGLVYIAAFAPNAGESPGGISQTKPPAAIGNIAPDSDGYLWILPDKFHESFCQDLVSSLRGFASWHYGNGADRKDLGLEARRPWVSSGRPVPPVTNPNS